MKEKHEYSDLGKESGGGLWVRVPRGRAELGERQVETRSWDKEGRGLSSKGWGVVLPEDMRASKLRDGA